jgi:hypothetical protein
MRRAMMLACLVMLAAATGARAQTAVDESCGLDTDASAFKLLRLTLNQPTQAGAIGPVPAVASAPAPAPSATPTATTAANTAEAPKPAEPARTPLRRLQRDPAARLSGDSIRVVVTLEGADPATWTAVNLKAAARTRDHAVPAASGLQRAVATPPGGNDLCRYRFTGTYAQLRSFEGRQASIEINYPDRIGFAPREAWTLVVAMHHADTDAIFGYGTVEVEVGSVGWSMSVSLGLLLLAYGLLVLVAMRVNRRRLDAAAEAEFGTEGPPPRWRLKQAANPVFITQDASGLGSLGRLQLLAFTLAVAFVFVYVFVRTGAMAEMSPDVLKLLGITVAGSAFGRLAAESGSVSTANRIWLKGKGLLLSETARLPAASDLVYSDGEVDIARVQALIFSSITIVALLASGPRDLGGFAISDEMLYLLGLSQLTYVAGKAIPAESVRRLNREVDALRAAEKQVVALGARRAMLSATKGATEEKEAERLTALARTTEEAATASATWHGALAAASETLVAVYGDMLVPERLDALRAAA